MSDSVLALASRLSPEPTLPEVIPEVADALKRVREYFATEMTDPYPQFQSDKGLLCLAYLAAEAKRLKASEQRVAELESRVKQLQSDITFLLETQSGILRSRDALINQIQSLTAERDAAKSLLAAVADAPLTG